MPFKIHKSGVTAAVRLTPGARREGVMGLMDVEAGKKALKISVRTRPEDGKANKALLALLAKEWDLPQSTLSLLSGDTSRQKVVLVTGDGATLLARLTAWLGQIS